jgi:hypothetical protein
MSIEDAYEQLLDLLLEIPQFQQPETRNILFDSLPNQIANIAVRSPIAINDLQNLIILLKRVGKLNTGEWLVVKIIRVTERYLSPNQDMHHQLDAILAAFESSTGLPVLSKQQDTRALPDTTKNGRKATTNASNPPLIQPTSPTPIPSYEQFVFISYAWGDEREEIVDKIDKALQERGLKIIRDKRDLEYKGSIQKFMERIGRGDCVIVVVSDKYLRSPNCMFELVEIAENKEFRDRIFPVIWKDANIYDPLTRIVYIEHWEFARKKLARAMKKLDPANLQGLREEMDLYDRIRDRISGLTSILKDMNALTPEMHEESNFNQLYDAIEKRLKETRH